MSSEFMLISLLIWRLVEHQMRNHLRKEGKTLDGWDNKPTRKPTLYMLTIKFKGALILKLGHSRTLGRKLTRNQLGFLTALGLNASIFTLTPDTG